MRRADFWQADGANVPRSKLKLLVIQFKYHGDVVVATPTLRALRRAFPDWELHVLVSQEAAPLIARLPWIDRVWGFPRIRGRINARSSLQVVRRGLEKPFFWQF